MRSMLTATALAIGLALAPAARAAEEPPPGQSSAELAMEGLGKLMQALESFIRSIPQFEAPVVTEEGDIVIRRKRETAPPSPPPVGAADAPPTITI